MGQFSYGIHLNIIVLFPSSRDVMQSQGIVLQTVFESMGDALAILITLDEIFKAGDTFKEHWTQYKRYMVYMHVYYRYFCKIRLDTCGKHIACYIIHNNNFSICSVKSTLVLWLRQFC